MKPYTTALAKLDPENKSLKLCDAYQRLLQGEVMGAKPTVTEGTTLTRALLLNRSLYNDWWGW